MSQVHVIIAYSEGYSISRNIQAYTRAATADKKCAQLNDVMRGFEMEFGGRARLISELNKVFGFDWEPFAFMGLCFRVDAVKLSGSKMKATT